MILVLSIIIAAYCILLIALIVGWGAIRTTISYKESITNLYSIIIPFRNEEENIKALIASLGNQNFPRECFEVILVDDHSEDSSTELVKTMADAGQISISLLRLQGQSGKKSALLHGIKSAKGSVVITTDADCTVEPNWLRSFASHYELSDVQMVFGPVTFKDESSLFEKIQIIEFASLIGTGASSLALGMPNMCNGANLSFRKASFFEVGGYKDNENIASGDDEFLMHKFASRYGDKVCFNKSRDAIVHTKAHKSAKAFFYQRKRWAGKWRYYASLKTIGLALFIFLFNAAFITALALCIINASHYFWLLIPLLSKVFLEGFFLYLILKFLKKRLNIALFIFLQFTYPIYVIIFGIAANFGKYTWKGRRL